MRLIDADKIKIDCMTNRGAVAVSQSQLANTPTYELNELLEKNNKQIRAEVIEFISDKLIYPLLDECDRGLWEHISYIELAEEWVKVLNDNPYPKVKNHTEARKRELRQWIAEQLKEQMQKGAEIK